MGIRPVGRPRQRWKEDVMEDLKKLKVKNWKETAKDRRTWRDLADKAKPYQGLYCQLMMIILYYNLGTCFGRICRAIFRLRLISLKMAVQIGPKHVA
jgi:hypothetical protein